MTAEEEKQPGLPAKAESTQPETSKKPTELGFFTVEGFNALWRASRPFAFSGLVPKIFDATKNERGENAAISSCAIALDISVRTGLPPLMVFQNLCVVNGRPTFMAQGLIALVAATGRFSSIRYQSIGERGTDSWGIVASMTELSTGDVLTGPEVTIEMAKKAGWYGKERSLWPTLSDLLLRYRAAAFLIRTQAPEVGMGLLTTEEARDIGPEETQQTTKKVEPVRVKSAIESLLTSSPAESQLVGVDFDVDHTPEAPLLALNAPQPETSTFNENVDLEEIP